MVPKCMVGAYQDLCLSMENNMHPSFYSTKVNIDKLLVQQKCLDDLLKELIGPTITVTNTLYHTVKHTR